MNIQQVLKNYLTLQSSIKDTGGIRLPSILKQTYSLTKTSQRVATDSEAKEQLNAFKPTEGWVGYQSRNKYFRDGVIPDKAEYGVLLNAEAVNANKSSLHIRYDGNGKWIVTQFNITKDSEGEYIADQISHLASDEKLKPLTYLHFWHLHDTQGCEPAVACFTGFGE